MSAEGATFIPDFKVTYPDQDGPAYLVTLDGVAWVWGTVWRIKAPSPLRPGFSWRWRAACGHLDGDTFGEFTRQMAADTLVSQVAGHVLRCPTPNA
jgi:hypothetical protein